MTLLQAILLGGVYWLRTVEPMYGGDIYFRHPLGIVFFVGLILGDMPTAIKVGAMVQPMFLGMTGAGGAVPDDKAAAGLGSAAVVITSGLPMDQAVALAVTVSLLLAQLHTIRRVVASTWVHMADTYAENCNIKGIFMAGLVYTNLAKIVIFWVPMTLMLYFGAGFIGEMIASLPDFVKNGLSFTGKLLPALGFGMTINVIGRRDLLPYFIGGFFFAKYAGLSSMPVAITGLFIAFLDMRFNKAEVKEEGVTLQLQKEIETGQHLLDKHDIFKAWVIWWWGSEQSNSFERLQSLAFCMTMAPILKKLYHDDKNELREGLKRHLLFFNTEGIWGSVIHGIVISMEEQRAMGMDVPTEAIVGIKTGLMGPFAGIGDTIDWATLVPLTLVFFLPYAAEGHWWASVLPCTIILAINWCLGLSFFKLGYRMGTGAAMSILQSGQIQRVITFFSVMGLFVMGGLSADMVDVQCALVIQTSGTPMSIQADVLDKIIPGLLSILSVFAVYGYLKKGGNMLKATLWMLLFGLTLGCLGIMGAAPGVA